MTIKEVYKKYKKCFLIKMVIESHEVDNCSVSDIMVYDLWQAIKQHIEQEAGR